MRGITLSRRTLLAALLAVSCRRSAARTRSIARVVSLSPSTTETVFALGAGALLFGRSRFCNFPEEVQSLPTVGGFVDPNLEAIVALRPDLVVGAHSPAGPALSEALAKYGMSTYLPRTESIGEILAMIRGLGDLLARKEAADALALRIDDELQRMSAELRARTPPRVLWLFGVRPLVAAGPSGFPHELLERARARNVVVDGPAYPNLSLERLFGLDPDVILLAQASGMSEAMDRPFAQPGFAELRAVRAGNLRVIDADATLRPGPRIADGVRVLGRAIHGPEALP